MLEAKDLESNETLRGELPEPVGGSLRQYAADAPSGIGYVTLIAWNDVDVCVWDGLTCRDTDVQTDVIPIRPVLSVDGCLYYSNQIEHALLFVVGKREEVSLVSAWNNERVTRV